MIIKIDSFKNLRKTFGASILECFNMKQLRELEVEFCIFPRGKNKADIIKGIVSNSQRINKTIRVEIY